MKSIIKHHYLDISFILMIAVQVVGGYWANLALYKRAVAVIRESDELNLDNDAYLQRIAEKGGVSVTSALVATVALQFLFVAALLLVSRNS